MTVAQLEQAEVTADGVESFVRFDDERSAELQFRVLRFAVGSRGAGAPRFETRRNRSRFGPAFEMRISVHGESVSQLYKPDVQIFSVAIQQRHAAFHAEFGFARVAWI